MINEKKDIRYQIMDLTENELRNELDRWSRQDLISWLNWNDPNGVYSDEESLLEFNNVMEKQEGIDIMVKQIIQA